MGKPFNTCLSGKCIHATQGIGCMFCNSPKANKEGRGRYIYPIVYEDCDCGDYKKIVIGKSNIADSRFGILSPKPKLSFFDKIVKLFTW